jgi:hypothetical protein
MRAFAPNKKSGPGFPAALPLFQPIRLSGYSTKERMPSLLQKTQSIFFDARRQQTDPSEIQSARPSI